MHWQTSRFSIDLSRPRVMGIVNVTPDSFSDGGQHATSSAAMAHCEALLRDGADILDIGGESTRPGAPPVSLEEELARVLPVIRHAVTLGVPVSVDTYKPAVMQAALDLGADIINDVWALRWRSDASGKTGQDVVAAHSSCGVCLMHMHRDPQTMQSAPMAGDVVPQVLSFLQQLALDLKGLGVDSTRICLDPGIGFGKTVRQAHDPVLQPGAFQIAHPVERRPLACGELADALDDGRDHVGFRCSETLAFGKFTDPGADLERKHLVGGGGAVHARGSPFWQAGL